MESGVAAVDGVVRAVGGMFEEEAGEAPAAGAEGGRTLRSPLLGSEGTDLTP